MQAERDQYMQELEDANYTRTELEQQQAKITTKLNIDIPRLLQATESQLSGVTREIGRKIQCLAPPSEYAPSVHGLERLTDEHQVEDRRVRKIRRRDLSNMQSHLF